jgi:CelD/BcsL family acetyltransferase involved in cellulose biosynthesis
MSSPAKSALEDGDAAGADVEVVRSACVPGVPDEPLRALRGRTRPEQALLASAAWHTAWATAFLDTEHWRGPLRTIVVRGADGRAAGAMPLATLRVARQDLAALGGFYQPFRTLLVAREEAPAIGAAVAEAFAAADAAPAVRLGGCGDPDPGVQGFLRRLRERGWAIYEEPVGYAYAASLPSSVDELETRMGKRLLQNVRYYERKMQRSGRVEQRLYTGVAADEWSHALAELAAVEERSWMGRDGGDMRFSGEANGRFWRALLADEDASRAAHAFVLYLDGRPVSFVFALDSGTTRYVLANQYDEAVHAHRTGSILYRRLFADAIEKGRVRMHLGRGDTGYKAHWGAEPSIAMRDYVACRPTITGRAIFGALMLRRAAGQLRVPDSVAAER